MDGEVVTAGAPDPTRPPFSYRLRTRVEISDTDLGAVVYYARYPHYLDQGVVAYRRQLGISPLGPEGHLFVVRNMEISYRSSARFDEVLDVWVRTSALGRTSHTMHVVVEEAATATVRCEASIVVVGISSYENGRPTRVPDDMAAAIRAFEGDPPPP